MRDWVLQGDMLDWMRGDGCGSRVVYYFVIYIVCFWGHCARGVCRLRASFGLFIRIVSGG